MACNKIRWIADRYSVRNSSQISLTLIRTRWTCYTRSGTCLSNFYTILCNWTIIWNKKVSSKRSIGIRHLLCERYKFRPDESTLWNFQRVKVELCKTGTIPDAIVIYVRKWTLFLTSLYIPSENSTIFLRPRYFRTWWFLSWNNIYQRPDRFSSFGPNKTIVYVKEVLATREIFTILNVVSFCMELEQSPC